jgi:uncharacterized membrane protein YdcZ (DUF606 family)
MVGLDGRRAGRLLLAGIVAFPSMSSATIIGAAIFGQLIASMVIDHFG